MKKVTSNVSDPIPCKRDLKFERWISNLRGKKKTFSHILVAVLSRFKIKTDSCGVPVGFCLPFFQYINTIRLFYKHISTLQKFSSQQKKLVLFNIVWKIFIKIYFFCYVESVGKRQGVFFTLKIPHIIDFFCSESHSR